MMYVYLYIQDISSSCEVNLKFYYINPCGVRHEPPGIFVFPLCPRRIIFESFFAYPIWTRARPTAQGYVVFSDISTIRDYVKGLNSP
jgi:hypothetical protein